MENSKENNWGKEGSIPSLIKAISANEVVGFDTLKEHKDLKCEVRSCQPLSISVLVSCSYINNAPSLSAYYYYYHISHI